MKLKFPIILTLLILLPIIVLAWMGTQLLRNNSAVQAHQQQQLVNSQLRAADQRILAYFTELESALLESPSFQQNNDSGKSNNNPNKNINAQLVRNHIQQSPYIEHIFVLDTKGKLLFPSKQTSSRKEQLFSEKTAELWSSMEAFRPNTPADLNRARSVNNTTPNTPNNNSSTNPNSANSIQKSRVKAEKNNDSRFSVSGALSKIATKRQQSKDSFYADSSNQELASAPEAASAFQLQEQSFPINTGHGWTVWRTGTEAQIFFWFWNAQNQLTGLKLINSFWLAELINRLPDDRNAADVIGDARIQLINEKQDVIYQWGLFEHSLIENIQPLGQRILGHPLDGWRLAYFSPKNINSSLQWMFYLGVLLTVALLILGLGFYIWREYRRDMRTAEQRVTFVNQVSHELKTPLTNICLYAELLESENEHADADSKINKYTQVLTAESQRLGRLINNVLSFSRSQQTEQEEQRIDMKAGNINEVIRSTVDLFKPAFSAKDIHIELDLQADDISAFDRNVVEQVLNNLLGNIEKYAATGKYALITSRSPNNTSTTNKESITEIHVIDHGPGISKAVAKKLFEPFYRGSEKLTEGVSGTGIGLSIARDLCRLHGGDLTLNIDSTLNKGSTKGAHFIASINASTEIQG